MKFKEYINEGNQIKTDEYVIGPTKSGSKKIYLLSVTEKGWEKIKKLFDNDPKIKRGIIDGKTKNVSVGFTNYDIDAQVINLGDGSKKYRIYGRSGDYTFGLAPAYFNFKYNRFKPAKNFFDKFVKEFF